MTRRVACVTDVAGVASIAIWRTYAGHAPENDRVLVARALQARATQVSEQLVQTTKGLEQTLDAGDVGAQKRDGTGTPKPVGS